MRRYWPITPVTDSNPHLVFRPRGKEKYKLRKHRKGDSENYNKLLTLKESLSKAHQLLELVLKKEELKMKLIEFNMEEFLQKVQCIISPAESRPMTVVV